nr:MAG TPA: hypothetical protein [Caudoviricetes sp.]
MKARLGVETFPSEGSNLAPATRALQQLGIPFTFSHYTIPLSNIKFGYVPYVIQYIRS